MTDHNTKSAVYLSEAIASKKISPVDLVEDCIAAFEAQNTRVNAIVTPCFETAREQAKIAENESPKGPLHGLPVLIKDLVETKGIRTTYGSLPFKDNIPDFDEILVERLKSSGAIILGKTNTPEFGAGANTRNDIFGATGNPFNTDLTAGGSSGGSSAALACDMAPLATGSDLGGSLRIPASFCSVVGMRPSSGLVPSQTHVSGFSHLWSDGPMARNVADCELLLKVMAGFDARDPISMDAPETTPFPDASKLKVGFSTDLGVAEVDDGIRAIFEGRKESLRGHFKTARDLGLDMSDATEVFSVLRAESMVAAFGDLLAQKPDQIGPNVKANVEQASQFSLIDAARANASHTQIYRKFQALFDDIDILICPATAVSPFPVTQNFPTQINGKELEGYYAWFAVTWALSLTSCPIVTIPCGLDHQRMPFGIQIVGRRGTDFALLQVAKEIERILDEDGLGRISPQR